LKDFYNEGRIGNILQYFNLQSSSLCYASCNATTSLTPFPRYLAVGKKSRRKVSSVNREVTTSQIVNIYPLPTISPSDILIAVRVFKNKWFNRWASREDISNGVLFKAAKEILEGIVEADLGGGLFKKRLARTGGGKRGGYRTIVGYVRPNSERIIFLYAFAKSEKANISDREEAALSLVAEAFVSATDKQVGQLLSGDALWEVKHNE
jgi:hypothetical protein